MNRAQSQIGRRCRQVVEVCRGEGPLGLADRVRRVTADWLTPKTLLSPVKKADLLQLDLSRPPRVRVPAILAGEPLVANWVITPPAPGSGGHTTLFRIARYLGRHGYQNRMYFYDAYGGDHSYYESIARNYYEFDGSIGRVEDGMEDAHVVFATGWPTAFPVFNSRCAGKRFYLVQDFEPYFYPVGATSALAESTYRMGLHGIGIGRCYADKLRSEFGMTIDTFRYGCDVSRYRRWPESPRSGVVFYARRESARRGFELGLMALEAFAARRPDIEIHIYGDRLGRLPFAFVDHGRLTPEELNTIYNRCYAGLSLSFTNVSLVALEMLAAGCIPVVNDTVQVRTDLENSFVRYADPYPQALAAQLEAVVEMRDYDQVSSAAAASVSSTTWEDAGAAVDGIIRRALARDSAAEAEGTAMVRA